MDQFECPTMDGMRWDGIGTGIGTGTGIEIWSRMGLKLGLGW